MNNFFRSKWFIAAVPGLAVIAVLIYLFFFRNTGKDEDNTKRNSEKISSDNKLSLSKENLPPYLDNAVDSVLFTFGLKQEWITTVRIQDSIKKIRTSGEHKKYIWFRKSVIIPLYLSPAEINLELNGLFSSSGLIVKADEDIRSKEISIYVFDTLSSKDISLINISIIPSEKAVQENGIIVVIAEKLTDFTTDEQKEIINSAKDFSFLVKPDIEDAEILNNLFRQKADLLFLFSFGDLNDMKKDFRNQMNPKEISMKIRAAKTDFPFLKNVLLKYSGIELQDTITGKYINKEFASSHIQIFRDTVITKCSRDILLNKDNFISFCTSHFKKHKKLILHLDLNFTLLKDFLKICSSLKRLGNRFMNLTEYQAYEERLWEKEEQKLKKTKIKQQDNRIENKSALKKKKQK